MTLEQVIQNIQVCEGNILKLPNVQIDRKTYLEVAKKIEGIGGKWKGGKTAGFVFDYDPSERLAQIKGGESVNLKKDFQFFETPDPIADAMVEMAGILDGDTVLEPSAGLGAIIKAMRRKPVQCHITAVEMMPENARFLRSKQEDWNFFLREEDFLGLPSNTLPFAKIIANPPFSKNQDIDHVLKMYSLLADGGKIVSVMSSHWCFSQNKKESNFRQWLESVGAEIVDVERGAFSESGTEVAAKIVIINKHPI